MKLNLSNHRLLTILTIFNTLLLIPALLIKILGVSTSLLEHLLLYLSLNISYTLIVIFLINILWTFKEKPSIVTSFKVYACLTVLHLIKNLLHDSPFAKTYALLVGYLTIVITIYLTIQVFKIKNSLIAIPYRMFALSLFSVMIIELIVIIATTSAEDNIIKYVDIMRLLAPISILYIIKKTTPPFKNEKHVVTAVLG
jgi:hypothetical protein